MEAETLEIICLEMKYCEYCGSLWLRARGNEEVYCEACQDQLAALPFPDTKTAKPRLPAYKGDLDEGRDGQVVFCGKGGNA